MLSSLADWYSIIPVSGLREGDLVMLKNFPCKVVGLEYGETSAKNTRRVDITGEDIFTHEEHHEARSSGDTLDAPEVNY